MKASDLGQPGVLGNQAKPVINMQNITHTLSKSKPQSQSHGIQTPTAFAGHSMASNTPNNQGSVVNVLTLQSATKPGSLRETPMMTPSVVNTTKRMSEAPHAYGQQHESKTSVNNTKRNSLSTNLATNEVSIRGSLSKQKESKMRNQESLNHHGSK